MRYPLFTLLAEDGEGCGQPVAFGLLAREDQEHIEMFLNNFAANNDIHNTVITVVDKDMAEINAVNKCWPACHVIICYFHVLRAVDRHLATANLSASDKHHCSEVIFKCFSNLINAMLSC